MENTKWKRTLKLLCVISAIAMVALPWFSFNPKVTGYYWGDGFTALCVGSAYHHCTVFISMENQQNRKHPTCRNRLVFAAGHLCICVSLLAVQRYRRCAEYGREPFGSTSDFLDWLCDNALYMDGFSGIFYSAVCPQIGLLFYRRGKGVYRK